MGKSYVENSLKRFLKRKVKITLGVVVTFLITGAVSFSAEEMSVDDYQKNYTKSFDNFKNLGTDISGEINQSITNSVTISKNESKNTVITVNSTQVELEKKYTSKKFASVIENTLKNSTSIGAAFETVKNDGIMTVGQKKDGELLENNGIIILDSNSAGQNTNKNGINNGLISVKNYGQEALGGNEVTLTNNGLIYSGYIGQFISNGNGNKAINTGLIKVNGSTGQQINKGDKSSLENYGLIEVDRGGAQTITKESTNAKAINYGILNMGEETSDKKGYGQDISGKGNSAYNYGLIKITDTNAILLKDGAEGYNYGVIISNGTSEKRDILTNEVVNKGLVITDNFTDNHLGKQWAKTGVLLNKEKEKYTVANNQFVQEFTSNSPTITNESFIDKTVGFVNNESVSIDNVQNKVIGAVVTEKLDKAVFNYSGDDLFLKDTSLVGYFETSGTLLDVGTGNLTLAGDTNITAVKNDLSLENVYAVKLGKDATVTIADEAKINGLISGGKGITFANTKGNYTLADSGLVEVVVNDSGNKNLNYIDITLQSGKELNDKEDNGQTDKVQNTIAGLKLSTEKTTEGLVNKVTIKDGLTVGKDEITVDGKNYSIYDDNTKENVQLEMTVENLNDLKGDVLLGAGKDTFVVENKENKTAERVTVDLGAGEDTFKVKYGETKTYTDEETGKETGYSVFDYKVNNAENVILSGKGHWTIGENAHIGFTDNGTKVGNTALLKAADGATLNIIMNKGGSDLNNMIEKGRLLEKGDRLVLGTDKDSLIKYQIGKTGLPFTAQDTSYTADYGIEKDANVIAPIFNVTSDGKTTSISLKTAEQAGVGNYAPIYNAYINQVANKNWDVIKYINSLNSNEDLTDRIIKTNVNAKAYYTAGTVVTKNITDSYLSAVEDFKEKAGKGEWLAQGKYINSDTEFDGGSKVKGYDGDINSAVGMIEYGLTENTSYGVAFGGGDTTVDIDGGGKLDGDNYYLGFYTKHRTSNGIDLVGNFGIMKSDLDSSLGNEFGFTVGNSEISEKTFEKGTADSTAFALSLKGKKDFYITDSVKLQPVLGARMTLINQDKAENPAMNFEIKEQDVFIAEGILGVNAAKEFTFENGKLELNTGIEYSFAASTENEDAEYRLFNNDDIKIENSKIASSKGTAHVGFDYEHESGVGFNGKYEMMWSDKGDDSRITAGISYRF